MDQAEIKRDFKGIWIPKETYLDDRLSTTEKILLAEIDSLSDNEKGGCYASNKYLAGFLKVVTRQLQRYLSNLKELGLITQKDLNGKGRILISKTTHDRNVTHTMTEMSPLHDRNVTPPSILYSYNKVDNKGIGKDTIDEIYSIYPSRDVNNNDRSTGKCGKDKQKIVTILKRKSKEELTKILQNYLSECALNKVYLKNFGTFLNQLPEPVEEKQEQVKAKSSRPPEGYPFVQQSIAPESLAKIKGYNGDVAK